MVVNPPASFIHGANNWAGSGHSHGGSGGERTGWSFQNSSLAARWHSGIVSYVLRSIDCINFGLLEVAV